jgi:S-adenosylmethionine:tRNA ribosyltransferase-isomerase
MTRTDPRQVLAMTELDLYDYALPRELIAQHPLPRRADARLMLVDRRRQTLDAAHVRDLPEILAAGDCLVLNDTRVVPARLEGYRTLTGGRWCGLFLSADDRGNWRVLCKTRGTLKPGESITLQDRRSYDAAQLRMLINLEEGVWAARPEPSEPHLQLLDRVGRTPLPPYIRGGRMVEADQQAYQTVFAERPGAVAAPTAGLHFTKDLLDRLQQCGVGLCRVTLHVGAGSFRPIAAEQLSQHHMCAEWGSVNAAAVAQLLEARAARGRIVAVGTTTVRLLETAAQDGVLKPWEGKTDLFIRPPHDFAAVDALLTNFHLPKSTLLVLVRTFGGDAVMRKAYETAIRERYRFLSYGDAMLIL